jgi:hypothetical protein
MAIFGWTTPEMAHATYRIKGIAVGDYAVYHEGAILIASDDVTETLVIEGSWDELEHFAQRVYAAVLAGRKFDYGTGEGGNAADTAP